MRDYRPHDDGQAWATFPGDNGEILYERAGIRAPYVLPDTRIVTPDGNRTAVAVPRKALTPAWSPDGSKIAYSTADDDGTKLVVQDFSTEQRDRVLTGSDLADSPARIIDVAFGPTGDRLVFCAEYSRGTPSSRLFVVNTDGSNLQMISGERPMCHADLVLDGQDLRHAGASPALHDGSRRYRSRSSRKT